MRAVVQRVTRADVRVDHKEIGAIDHGLMVLLGVHRDDTLKDVSWMADHLVHLRIFDDRDGRM
ncbi:MAG TPA: D-tyrosyl-tRNA(Tyr) deacylase, partial [Proteobacteria bacterium]|nr:D-tyrosyl-tRNA(Tyr) deacylase [Pseudomonadota bacterium]